ncbi:hypothetical protein HYZ78_02480 [Candidatus Microgenomates bacterium]|nr:hypothetical protein [Candidatus Microgenomates bacterium]
MQIPERTKKKKIPVTHILLFTLEKFVEGGEFIVGTSNELRDWINAERFTPEIVDKYAISRAIKRLRERKLLELEEKRTGEIVLRLTNTGKDFIYLLKEEDNQWDGKWRIVIFDIPESKRLVRDVLRRRLKSWKFERWQKSVWASKKNFTAKMRDLIKELEIDDWVLVIESDNVGF